MRRNPAIHLVAVARRTWQITNMEKTSNNAVIIVAAGRGSRISASADSAPKQYRILGGKTVLAHTLEAFTEHSQISHIVVCIHRDDETLYSDTAPAHSKIIPPVHGGATRQLSVFAGLGALADISPDNVLIHDAARPFIDSPTISAVLQGLTSAKACLPSVALADTIKKAGDNGTIIETIPRNSLYAAQTPQGFHFSTIHEAHEKASLENRHDFTDDSALAEWANIPVQLVEGSAANSKITTNSDLIEAEKRMSAPLPDIRTGHGYDVHQFVPGSSVRLCGVDIDHTHKLSGHSDADVGLHALTDALLGAISDGDIGSHFPPSDPQWKGTDSDQFLVHAVNRVKKFGGTITHMDVTLLCEFPKITPHRDAMRSKISKITGIDVSRISVKATTNERMGFIGREEGMAALATATVVMETK